jgi:predicted nucleic acid-binding protein
MRARVAELQWFVAHTKPRREKKLVKYCMRQNIAATLPFGKRRSALQKRIEFLRDDFSDAIIPFDLPQAAAWAEYAAQVTSQHGKKFWTSRTIRDSALAAIARACSLTVVTRDTGHFPFIATLNPF